MNVPHTPTSGLLRRAVQPAPLGVCLLRQTLITIRASAATPRLDDATRPRSSAVAPPPPFALPAAGSGRQAGSRANGSGGAGPQPLHEVETATASSGAPREAAGCARAGVRARRDGLYDAQRRDFADGTLKSAWDAMLKDPMLARNGADDKYHKPSSAGSAARRMISSAEVWTRNNKQTLVRLVGVVSLMMILATLLGNNRAKNMIPAVPPAVEEDLASLGVRGANVASSLETVASTRTQGFATQETEAEEEEAAAAEEEEGDFEEEQLADEEREEFASASASSASSAGSAATPSPMNKPFADYTLEELYENWEELQECPDITVPPKALKKSYQWWGLKSYARMYSEHPIKRCVPKMRRHIKLNLEDFQEYYRRWGRPVLFYFDNIRHLGFTMKSYTLDELAELFPYDPSTAKTMTYEANRKYSKTDEIDLGPAIHNFKTDGDLVRQKGGKRNFPRNMKVKPESMSKLGVQIPPLIDMKGSTTSQIYQTPSLWMGTSTSGTQFHHDCCDNFVMMIHGTKRFTLAPATDWNQLSPRCVGKAKSLCYANIAEPTAESYSHFNKMVVDVEPGQILYMPAGLFHHIQNLGPTLMTNIWTRGRETLGIMSCNKK